MEKKWDTVTPADFKRLFVSGKYMRSSMAHCIICTRMFRGKMHYDRFNGIEILHGEKVGYCYPSGLKKTLCKWEVYVPLVTKGLMLVMMVPTA
jgi:hypothetical protein